MMLMRILCSGEKKYKISPLLAAPTKSMMSPYFDDDLRRKTIFRAFVFSEFRSNALCIDFIQHEIYKS